MVIYSLIYDMCQHNHVKKEEGDPYRCQMIYNRNYKSIYVNLRELLQNSMYWWVCCQCHTGCRDSKDVVKNYVDYYDLNNVEKQILYTLTNMESTMIQHCYDHMHLK
jgi:hypothetical protein